MDIKQDPNSIPNFSGGGRVGELGANEPEQVQSSVELDPVDGSAPGHAEDVPVGSGQDSLLDNGSGASVTPQPQPQAPTMAEAGGLPVDKSKTGEGSIDALVGAP